MKTYLVSLVALAVFLLFPGEASAEPITTAAMATALKLGTFLSANAAAIGATSAAVGAGTAGYTALNQPDVPKAAAPPNRLAPTALPDDKAIQQHKEGMGARKQGSRMANTVLQTGKLGA